MNAVVNILSIILRPLSYVYGLGACFRRLFYGTFGLRKPGSIDSWVIGNLSVGGSGKTPLVIELSKMLYERGMMDKKLAVLSRGYGRNTRGFLEVNELDSDRFGDEPCELFMELGGMLDVGVFVGEDRLFAIDALRDLDYGLVFLDDGMQHLPLKAKGYVLATNYHCLPDEDWCMPSGRLREFPFCTEQVDFVVVTKCPTLTEESRLGIVQRLGSLLKLEYRKEANRRILFSGLGFDVFGVDTSTGNLVKAEDVPVTKLDCFAICGIAHGVRAVESWKSMFNIREFKTYSDHRRFCRNDVLSWVSRMKELGVSDFVCTRKDWMRLVSYRSDFAEDMSIWVVGSRPVFLSDSSEVDFMMDEISK